MGKAGGLRGGEEVPSPEKVKERKVKGGAAGVLAYILKTRNNYRYCEQVQSCEDCLDRVWQTDLFF